MIYLDEFLNIVRLLNYEYVTGTGYVVLESFDGRASC